MIILMLSFLFVESFQLNANKNKSINVTKAQADSNQQPQKLFQMKTS